MDAHHPFALLTPDTVLDAVESLGFVSDARTLTLNSYENRVFQVGIEDAQPLIAKFYRPQRWSDASILEEHQFSLELVEREIPVIPPMQIGGETLFEFAGFRFSLFKRFGGRAPEFEDPDHLLMLGRLVGRLHAVGAMRPFEHRPELTVQSFGVDSLAFLRSANVVPAGLQAAYFSVADDLLKVVAERFAQHPCSTLRMHGDLHVGNLLWRDESLYMVDLDDCRQGPAIQDLWMMLSGERDQRQAQIAELADGYNEFYDFDPSQLALIEPLRTLRLIHYSAWLARRWDDPAFPMHFPWFASERYWADQILTLREQRAALDEPVLRLF
ncbi:serine/threonine protein kinase [Pseudomonas neustonica]|uniref:Stress response kinase A n=1 Tax=Pseudomonas neustonica TaxID=2487346 RepID=A0ABX9XM86_9PSED|nr:MULTISPECIES: serine/threonine protein kinase [Pseudomonas]MAB25620.1 serine/threonine protein kinase [Pseudomonadales bacterium]HBX57011.1 serine/threonine protein kinase [Pseudomonas sp.]MBA6420590.1 serine/threonine protein kinase [Pseudomonas sp. 5Ae-yellow]ROZ83563.1 serine/threonine protein kinase [Pseudomonas sp. SSM44]ROZ85421.1 serine/threonine protein kinase [Pseudomonas neustonica]|tara:strand:+ start:795 stop:1775 length:981 start_codon:yes stop_codon:yes gene_type:complete